MSIVSGLSVWQKLKNCDEPIIMYGTGNGADKVIDILNERGITLNGVTASNSFVRNRVFRGFNVMPVSYFEELYESFTVIVTFGTSIPEVMENIFAIAKKHRVLVPCVPVIGTKAFDEKFLSENEGKIEKAYNLMADDTSKKVYEGYVNFLYGGELSLLQEITSPESEAFTKILKLSDNETYIDIGAYRGDTVDRFLSYTNGKYNGIICAEPDKKTFKKLMDHCCHLENFEAVNSAVTGIDGEIGFNDAHGRQSAVGGDIMIPSTTLTTLCKSSEPSYIKIDAEGCEYDILKAGSEVLKRFAPKLNVAVYHKSEDVFDLPILINSINPDYKIHLRHHPYIPAWDTLIYCV